jgi:hypothetical protein
MLSVMRSEVRVDAEAEQILDGFAAHIDAPLDAQYDSMAHGHGWKPAPGSALVSFRRDLAKHYGPGGDWDGSEADQAGVRATLMLAVSGQQLEAIRALLLARHVIFPIAPLARTILEATGRTFWLVDPRLVGLRNWAARAWTAQLEEITRQITTAKALSNQKVVDTLVRRKNQIRKDEIPGRFYPSEIENRNGQLIIRGQEPPGLSASLKYIGAGLGVADWHTGMYAFLSDATHPSPYTALETVQFATDGEPNRFGTTNMRREYLIIRAAVIAYQQSWLLTSAYYGHDLDVEQIKLCDQIEDVPTPEGVEHIT